LARPKVDLFNVAWWGIAFILSPPVAAYAYIVMKRKGRKHDRG
jgi:hypothetical protein